MSVQILHKTQPTVSTQSISKYLLGKDTKARIYWELETVFLVGVRKMNRNNSWLSKFMTKK